MILIALDLSLRAPGWFRYCQEGENASTQTGVFSPTGRGMDRIDSIAGLVKSLIPATATDVTVLIEGYAFGASSSHVREIAELGGVIRYMLWYRHIRVIEVAPSALKKFVTGKGNAEKNVILREVFRRWGFEAADDNEADAFALGKIGMCLLGIDQPTTDAQREVLAALRGERPAKKRKVA
jgi:crossover junction endodeoxyribonuclease RuvC